MAFEHRGQVLTALPIDFEAERAVLGCILIRERIADVLGELDVDDFLLPAHREIYGVMLELSAGGSPLDILTIGSELRIRGLLGKLEGGETYLLALSNSVPTATSVQHYIAIVRARSASRRLIMSCTEAAVRAGTEPAEDVIADLRVRLSGLRLESGGPILVSDSLPGYLDALEARQAAKSDSRVPSGLRRLDERLLGGVAVGQEVIVGANPGMGKTSLALQWAIHSAGLGVPALVFSLEMKRAELLDRAVSYVSGVDGARIAAGGGLDMETWRSIQTAARSMTWPLSIDDRKLTMDQIASETIRWREKHREATRAVVVVDYLGLIRSKGKAENRQQEVGGWSRDLKILAGDANCAMLVCAQLNRKNVENGPPERPVLSNLRDSGEIEQNADVVLFPWRNGTVAEVAVAKHRGGPLGVAHVMWNGPTTSFRDDGKAADTDDWRDR